MIVINQCKLIMCTHKSHRLCKQGIKNLKIIIIIIIKGWPREFEEAISRVDSGSYTNLSLSRMSRR